MPIPTITELYSYSEARLFSCMSDPALFEPTVDWAISRWADICDKLLSTTIPPSTTTAQARAAFIAAMQPLKVPGALGIPLLNNAFNAYAATLAPGMLPLFTGVPPPVPCFIPIIPIPQPTSAPFNLGMCTYLVTWAKTGTATMVGPPFTVTPWT